MKLEACFLCNKLKYLPFHITEIEEGDYVSIDVCSECAKKYLTGEPVSRTKPDRVDTSPFDLLSSLMKIEFKKESERCYGCGLTEIEFEKSGRFGCKNCYSAFQNKMENLVYPYHGAKKHTGKIPKRWYRERSTKKEEQIKTLRLQYAKALELEDYENAAVLKKQLDELIS